LRAMNCKQVHGKLQPLIDGALPPSQVLEITNHVQCCASCRQELQALQDLDTFLSAEPLMIPPTGLASAIANQAARQAFLIRRVMIPRWIEALTLGGLTIGLGGIAFLMSELWQVPHALQPVMPSAVGISALIICGGLGAFISLYYAPQI